MRLMPSRRPAKKHSSHTTSASLQARLSLTEALTEYSDEGYLLPGRSIRREVTPTVPVGLLLKRRCSLARRAPPRQQFSDNDEFNTLVQLLKIGQRF